MEITINLDLEDWRQFQKFLEKDLSNAGNSWMNSFWFNLILWAAITVLVMSVFQVTGGIHWPTAGLVSLIFVLIITLALFNIFKLKKAFAPSKVGTFIGEHHFKFDDEGIFTTGKGYEAKHRWSLVQRIERANGMILIFLDTAYAYVFAESKLEDPEAFFACVNEQHKKI